MIAPLILTASLLAPASAHAMPVTVACEPNLSSAVSNSLSRPASGWVRLFNGRDLAGWKVPAQNPYWSVEDGAIVGTNDPQNKGSMLYTESVWGDFELEFDARWNGEIDSGVMFHQPELQLQLGVSRSLKVDMTAAFYTGGSERYPVAGRPLGLGDVFKPGKWNSYRLVVRGSHHVVDVNGKTVTRYTDPRWPVDGPIGLQVHPGLAMTVEFKNLRIRSLGPETWR
ncbi:MAG: 3-keto-disaccharide hydrolase [Armatimonadaceae bacterium]